MRRIMFVGLLVSLLVIGSGAFALQLQTGNIIELAKGKVVNDNLLAAGEIIRIDGDVKGDLLAFGSEITINGNVDGNIIAAGGKVTLNGVVKNDLLAGAGEMYVGKDSRIGRDLYVGAGSANIGGKIFRNTKLGVGKLIIDPATTIKGSLDYSVRYSHISDKASIVGKVTASTMPDYQDRVNEIFAGIVLTKEIVGTLTILLIGILAIIFMPNQVKLINDSMTSQFWKSLGWGVLSILVIPLLITLLIITLIGAPLGMLLLAYYVFGIYIAAIFTSMVIGQWILSKINKAHLSLIWALAIGFVIYKLLTWVPIVGWLFHLIVLLWAFGALVSSRFETYKEAREKAVL
jgi:hypothetical protein